MSVKIKQSFDTIKQAMDKDFMYAWGWHCNVAVCSQDEGLSHAASNRAAARFMKICFDIDTSIDAYKKEFANEKYQTTTPEI